MFRIAFVFVALMVAALFVPPTIGAAPPAEIIVGGKVEGEIGEKQVFMTLKDVGIRRYFGAEIPVTLKAGQSISVYASVVGKGRLVVLNVLDPTGKLLGATTWGTKTINLTVEEVPASGKYKILVGSSHIGPFTLRASSPSTNETDRKKLEEELKQLKKRVAEIEAQLKGSAAKPEK